MAIRSSTRYELGFVREADRFPQIRITPPNPRGVRYQPVIAIVNFRVRLIYGWQARKSEREVSWREKRKMFVVFVPSFGVAQI